MTQHEVPQPALGDIERLADDELRVLAHALHLERLRPLVLAKVPGGRMEIGLMADADLAAGNSNLNPKLEPVPRLVTMMRAVDNHAARQDASAEGAELGSPSADVSLDPGGGRKAVKLDGDGTCRRHINRFRNDRAAKQLMASADSRHTIQRQQRSPRVSIEPATRTLKVGAFGSHRWNFPAGAAFAASIQLTGRFLSVSTRQRAFSLWHPACPS